MSSRVVKRSIVAAALVLATWTATPLGASAPPAATQAPPSLRGLTLTAALQALQARGLSIVFSSQLVRPTLRVESEPQGTTLRELLDAVLAPHGLRAIEGARGHLVVVAAPARRAVEVVPRFEEEIVVTPDTRDPLRSAAAVRSVATSEAEERPHLGNDLFRALGALPGTTTRETSSRLHVRGGREDDVLILLDGLELLEPYHLQEFDSALSIVAPTALERADLIPSGYPAEYGDRMGGVLDLTTTTPPSGHHLSFGLGLTHADAAGSGRLGSDRGSWYGSARGGSYRLALELAGQDANPRFWDAFAKVDLVLRRGHSVRVSALFAEDALGVEAPTPGAETYAGEWGNRYGWLTHHGLLRSTLAVESIASLGEIERRRDGQKSNAGEEFVVRDRRSLRLAGFKQIWRFQPAARFSLTGGLELRELGAVVDYANQRRLDGVLTPLRSQAGSGSTTFAGRFDFNQSAAFSTARLQRAGLTAEVGLRYDRDTFIDEEHLSPRLNLAWALTPSTVARVAWGWFYQSQRPNELQVEDDESLLYRAERAEHRVLQLEHRRPNGAALRIEAFERRVSRNRPRFDNLFDPVSFFPELEDDRVRIAPTGASAQGIELGFDSARHRSASWRLSYTYATARETIAGRQVPRAIDQRHAVNAGLGYRTPRGWSFDAAWTYHTGWPTTALGAQEVTAADGAVAIAPVLGPLNGERLPAYHRLDLRVTRSWSVAPGSLSAYVDLQNVYDRENVRGRSDFVLLSAGSGEVGIGSETTSWGGFLPSFGLRWSF